MVETRPRTKLSVYFLVLRAMAMIFFTNEKMPKAFMSINLEDAPFTCLSKLWRVKTKWVAQTYRQVFRRPAPMPGDWVVIRG